ncbi:MAG: DNA methylase [Lachnospiraceae bacterium]|nr:DNA methylase [Lachnospiraceae bacterium]
MSEEQRTYIAIDLKSFYASVECVARGLDPLNTNLLVADPTRTEKTICLAVSPSLKALGLGGRCRLFEAIQKTTEANALRRANAPGRTFTGKSYYASELAEDPGLEIDFIIAPPRMRLYMDTSTAIYEIYLKYISPEDIHVYSIDEVFMDVTKYSKLYNMTPHELAIKMIRDVLSQTGITATAGIGTNMYLAKIAMDITAKHMPADKDGVRIAELDEMSFRKQLWNHKPLTDFWMLGSGYNRRLQKLGLYTMGDIARCSVGKPDEFYNEDLLYKEFGINAELLIDHAWGWEPVGMHEIKTYRPENHSSSQGQVLSQPYPFDKARLVIREMTDLLVLDLVDKGLVTNQMVINVGYDIENFANPKVMEKYEGEVASDHYGRPVPKGAHGSINLNEYTSSTVTILEAVTTLFNRIVDPRFTVRRMNVVANNVIPEGSIPKKEYEQLNLFSYMEDSEKEKEQAEWKAKEHRIQKAVVEIKKRYGKGAMLKGMNLEEGATTIARNGQVGGHKA